MEIRARLGPYRLDELTGEGGVARVYKAWHTKLQRYEALKLLRDSMAHEATLVARFLSEARTAAKLHHPHIATIYSIGDGDGSQPYFTMEMVEGCDLGEHLRRHGPLTLDEATPLLQQIASAVDYAHSVGVIHRDIKPANILLGDSPSGGYTVKLVDFGIARVQAEEAVSRLTQSGGIVGTPKYISPEQANEQPVDYRADIYSFGVVAYEMMCGRTPFEGDEPATTMALLMAHVHTAPPDPRELAPALSQTTTDAILRSLAKTPEERFNSCGEFVRVLTAPGVADSAQSPAPRILDSPPPHAPRIAEAYSFPTPRPTEATHNSFARQAPVVPAPHPAAPNARPKRAAWMLLGASAGALLACAAVFTLAHPSPKVTPKGPGTEISTRNVSLPTLNRNLTASPPVLRPAAASQPPKMPRKPAAPPTATKVASKPAAPIPPHKTQGNPAAKPPTAPPVHAAATKASTTPPAAHAIAKAPAILTVVHQTAKALAPSTVHATAKELAPKAGKPTAKALSPLPAAHAATAHPAAIKTAPKPAAAHPRPIAHPNLAAAPAKLAAMSVAHSAKPAARPVAHLPKRVPRFALAKRVPRFGKAHPPFRGVRGKSRQLRRLFRPLRTHAAGGPHQRHALADAWVSSSRQEMALAHSFHAKGDSVQAAALAQNAADSQRHALGTSSAKKRKRH